MKANIAIFLFAFLSAFSLASDGPAAKTNPLAHRAQEIEKVIEDYSLVPRPAGADMNEILQCRAQDLFDADKTLFTEADFKELSQLKCHDKFCVGDKAPFDATMAAAIKRNNQRIEFLKNQRENLVNVRGSDTIPSNLSWPKYATSDEELKGRWQKLLTFWVLKEILKANPDHPDQVDVKAAQVKVIDLMIKDLAAQNAHWSKMTEEEKENDLLHARMTCLDKYSRIIAKTAVAARGINSGQVDYPITMGIKFFQDQSGETIITGVIPGSAASISNQFLPLDKVTSITYDGKKFDMTKAEGKEVFNIALEAKKPLELEVERDGKKLTLKTETGHSLPYEAMVFAQDRSVGGKRFRIVSVPMYVADDEKLSPKEKISTAAQVQYALSDRDNYDAMVLDLRGNSGGVADQGAILPAVFLSEKENPTAILASKQKGETAPLTRFVGSSHPYSDKPLFVLIDQKSASSAEITVAALKRANRAVIIGEPTFGKGIEQVGVPLSDGSLLLQTANVNLGFDGESFHKKGLTPHLSVPYLSGVFPMGKENQDVEVPEMKTKPPAAKFTEDYYQVNQKALEATQDWAKRASKEVPILREYASAMKDLKKTHNQPQYVLNLEKAKGINHKVMELENRVIQLGAQDNSHNPFSLGFTTDWSLLQAAQYMDQEKKLKEKSEAAE